MKIMEITLCMIVKNEEKYIKTCLENALTLVGKAVVVDTGSTDRTLEILAGFGSQVDVRRFDWIDDFAAARNYSLEGISGDWILVLDADERLVCDAAKLRGLLDISSKQGYDVPLESDIGGETLLSKAYVRLFRNLGYRYFRAIHEQLAIEQNTVGNLEPSVCKIVHYGYSSDNLQDKNKIDRNLNILLAELQKKPSDAFLCYHIGAAYGAKKDFAKSLEYYFKSRDLGKKKGYSTYHSTLYKKIALTYHEMGRFDAGVKFVDSIVQQDFFRQFVDLFFIKGLCLKQLRRYEEAAKVFTTCLQIGDNRKFESLAGRGSFLAQLELARLYRESGKDNLVVPAYVEAVMHPRNVRRAGLEEFRDYLQEHDLPEIKNELDKLTGRKENG